MNRKLPSVSFAAHRVPVLSTFRLIAYGAAVWATLASGTVAAAELKIYLQTGALAYSDPSLRESTSDQTGTTLLSASNSAQSQGVDYPSASASASGYVSADYGILKGRAEAQASFPHSIAGVSIVASSSDVLFINPTDISLNGQVGYMTTKWLAVWELAASGTTIDDYRSSAFASFGVGISSGTPGSAGSAASLYENVCGAEIVPLHCTPDQWLYTNGYDLQPFSKSFSVTSRIVFGEPIFLDERLQIGVGGRAAGSLGGNENNSFSAAAFADRSTYWDGIGNVTNNGAPVEFTVTSGSGTDYSRSFVPTSAVPAPPAFWLLISGLFPIAWAGRRKRSPHTA